MKKVIEKIEKFKGYIKEVKKDKVKKTCTSTALILAIVPVGLITLKCLMEAMLGLLVHRFDIFFVLNVVGASVLLLIETIMLMTILYLNNLVKDEEWE